MGIWKIWLNVRLSVTLMWQLTECNRMRKKKIKGKFKINSWKLTVVFLITTSTREVDQ